MGQVRTQKWQKSKIESKDEASSDSKVAKIEIESEPTGPP